MTIPYPSNPNDGQILTHNGVSYRYTLVDNTWETYGGQNSQSFVGEKPTGPSHGFLTYDPATDLIEIYNESTGAWEPTSAQPAMAWSVSASGTDHYVFSGAGFSGTETDPSLTVNRGQTYLISNTTGAHPFQIQSAAGLGGTVYNTGVTNNGTTSGTLVWEVPMDAPATLYYQCTSHANMGGTINVLEPSVGGSSTDYMGMTGEGAPGVRPDGSALQVGDTFVDNSVFPKNVESYWWTGSAWLSSSNATMEGAGAPTLTTRFTGAALVENDLYVDETNADLYRWDSSAWQKLVGGVSSATPTVEGKVLGHTSLYNTTLGYYGGVATAAASSGTYGNTFIGPSVASDVTGNDNMCIGSSSGLQLTAATTGVTIIGSHDGTGLNAGDFVLAPNGSYGSSHTKKLLQFNATGALGVPTSSLGSVIDYGSAGEVLTSTGLNTPPTWVAGGGGGASPAQPKVLGTVFGSTLDPTSGAGGVPYGSTFVGYEAGNETGSGYHNTAVGMISGRDLTTGYYNTFLGFKSGVACTTGFCNVALGAEAQANSTGDFNVSLGFRALSTIALGANNIAIGAQSGVGIAENSSNNIFIGYSTGNTSNGDDNLFIGRNAGSGLTTSNSTIIGGYNADSETLPNGTFILSRTNFQLDNKSFLLRINENGAFGVPTPGNLETPSYGTAGQVLTSQGTSTAPIWAAAGGGGSTDYMGMTGEGTPGVRPDGSALQVGDTFVDNSVWPKNVENYYYNGSAWKSSSNVILEGAGTPSNTARATGMPLEENDLYIDEWNADLYRWDSSAWQKLGGGDATPSAMPSTLGTVYGLTQGSGPRNVSLGFSSFLGTTTNTLENTVVGPFSVSSGNVSSAKYNVSVGTRNLYDLTTGQRNIVVGASSGRALTNGGYNILIGDGVLNGVTSSNGNLMIGNLAGDSLSVDINDTTIIGSFQGDSSFLNDCIVIARNKSNGTSNVGLKINEKNAFGIPMGNSLTTGVNYGAAGEVLTSQGINSAPVWAAAGGGGVGTDSNNNTWAGTNAFISNTTGSHNVALGYAALGSNEDGSYSSATGHRALFSNTSGGYNVANGYLALQSNTTGFCNTAIGHTSLVNSTIGSYNTALGYQSLYNNTSGGENLAIGRDSLFNCSTGSGNIGIGFRTSTGSYAPVFNPTTENNRLVLGNTSITDAYVQVAWTVVSDARDKMNFAPVPHGLDFVNQLEPTAFQFKTDRDTETPNGEVRYGFKAQDILALEGDNPVIIDIEDADRLKYKGEHLVPVLVNAVKELTDLVKELRVDITALQGG